MKKQLKSFAFAVLAGAVITSCADSASINQEAASSYTQEMGKIRSQGAIDTTSNTARRIHHVFNKMVPYANQANETGLKFNWQINVIKSKELNAWAMPGGKMAFYTGLVDTLQLNDNEIAVVMGHEMAHALKEHGKAKANFGTMSAIAAAAKVRLRPILMTTAAMIAGLVPLLYATGAGAVSRFSIGIVIVAGLAIGTLFTLFVLPVIYSYIASEHKPLPEFDENVKPIEGHINEQH